jgi:type III secretion system low calcium response chaperone LcrH/SycD
MAKEKNTEKTISTKRTVPEYTPDDVKGLIDKQVALHAENMSEEEIEMQKKALIDVFIEGKSPQEAMNLPEDFSKLLYKQAYDLYNLGLYEEANHVFRVLCFFEPASPKYQLGIAATNHQLGKHEIAATMYFASYYLDPKTPIPLFYISDCFLQMNEPGASYIVLKMATEVCGNQTQFQKLKARCYMMMKQLRKQYGIHKEDEEVEGAAPGAADIFSQLQGEAEKEQGAA